MAKVCIDPGHAGRYNQSPVVKSYYESVMNWNLAIFLENELRKRGIEVVKSRQELQKDLSLAKRGEAAKGCDLFLSIHSNACSTESVDYPVAIVLTDDSTTTADDVSRDIGAKLAAAVAKTMGTTQDARVQQRQASYDRNGDGLMNDNYYGVLHAARLQNVPAVLMEHSFHTNTRAAKWLLNTANLEKLAVAEANVIAAHFGIGQSAEVSTEELYRVQVGAFRQKANADAQLAKVEAAGFDAFIAFDSSVYRVQVGAFSKLENATAMLQKVTRAGFTAFVTPCQKPTTSSRKSLDTVAKEVLAGKWGNGAERTEKLTAAGYDAAAVQKRVNEMLK